MAVRQRPAPKPKASKVVPVTEDVTDKVDLSASAAVPKTFKPRSQLTASQLKQVAEW